MQQALKRLIFATTIIPVGLSVVVILFATIAGFLPWWIATGRNLFFPFERLAAAMFTPLDRLL